MVVVDGGNHIAAYPAAVLSTDISARQVQPSGVAMYQNIGGPCDGSILCAFLVLDRGASNGTRGSSILLPRPANVQRGYCPVRQGGGFGTMCDGALKTAQCF